MPTNGRCLLASRPVGLPTPANWSYVEDEAPEPAEGEALVRVDYLSLDPAMRAWMNDVRSYVPPVQIGEVMRAAGVGTVIASRSGAVREGDCVQGVFGVQNYAAVDAGGLTPVDTSLAPAPAHLGVLGISGLTAYVGLLDIGRPEPGQTVVVSGAAGSVGSVAGQIARIKGARAVGIAGGREKCDWLVDELGFDAAVDYKAGELRAQLREAAPDRVDVFFDNVGGEILDTVLLRLARGARIVISGAISQYNADAPPPGPSNYMQLLVSRATMAGFVIFDHFARFPQARADLAEWLASGELKHHEDVVHARVDQFPEVFLRLFRGENLGKLVQALDA
ncbi:MAG TPA: NADP-dependent oxidoreductase [Solirubrobacteraceae bacterium]|nr:NADP-dependent oxidoreductase [Solirubrobacteraceae bacterium]